MEEGCAERLNERFEIVCADFELKGKERKIERKGNVATGEERCAKGAGRRVKG